MQAAGFAIHPLTLKLTEPVPRGQTFFATDFVAERCGTAGTVMLQAGYE
jgi:hypothetical protein